MICSLVDEFPSQRTTTNNQVAQYLLQQNQQGQENSCRPEYVAECYDNVPTNTTH